MMYENDGVERSSNSRIMMTINDHDNVVVELMNKYDKDDIIMLVREDVRVGIVFPDETVFIYRTDKVEEALEKLGITDENYEVKRLRPSPREDE